MSPASKSLRPRAIGDGAARAEAVRRRKAELGQFFTPEPIAAFMAARFPDACKAHVRLLDAGAGAGILTREFLRRAADGRFGARCSAVAYEIDPVVRRELQNAVAGFADVEVRGDDFILSAVGALRSHGERFTHAILNPPYKKMASRSVHREALRSVGIETVNFYSAFVALALLSLEPGGFLCAIIPRSFCNGPYYRAFRQLILRESALRELHVFGSRVEAFGDDGVLQENVIILLQRGGEQRDVRLSTSTDGTFHDLAAREIPFGDVVRAGDREAMFRVPSEHASELPAAFAARLDDLGIQVSTGPVVDFRLKEHLRQIPGPGAVPLVYPTHFGPTGFRWPYGNPKKPSAIADNALTRKWLYPAGNYTVVRRLSSKEERRRIVANTVCEDQVASAWLGFENHVNVFHRRRTGLSRHEAWGLAAYLNWPPVDAHFRSFSGHTQVNATDLRGLAYPDADSLVKIGRWAEERERPREEVDRYIAGLA